MRKTKAYIKYILKMLLGREILISRDVKLPVEWFGNVNAGFFVYTKDLNKNSNIFSFGVGEDISFDESLINRFHCTIYGFDPTPKSIQFVAKKNLTNFNFFDYGISNFSGTTNFFLPVNPDYVSGTILKGNNQTTSKDFITVKVKTFQEITEQLNVQEIDILKLDIEGSEYDVIDDILNSKIIIPQILIEFHHRFKNIGKPKTLEAINKLRLNNYKIIAISESREEFTFYKSYSNNID